MTVRTTYYRSVDGELVQHATLGDTIPLLPEGALLLEPAEFNAAVTAEREEAESTLALTAAMRSSTVDAALAKLVALGLTEDEARALAGG